MKDQINAVFEEKRRRIALRLASSLGQYIRLRNLKAPGVVRAIVGGCILRLLRDLREDVEWDRGYRGERRLNAMTPEEKTYMRAVIELKGSRQKLADTVGISWSKIEEDIREMEGDLDPWSEEEVFLLPQGVRDILLAKHFIAGKSDEEYVAEVRNMMVLRIRSIVARYNESRRIAGGVDDLITVDDDGRVKIDLSVIRGLDVEEGA